MQLPTNRPWRQDSLRNTSFTGASPFVTSTDRSASRQESSRHLSAFVGAECGIVTSTYQHLPPKPHQATSDITNAFIFNDAPAAQPSIPPFDTIVLHIIDENAVGCGHFPRLYERLGLDPSV